MRRQSVQRARRGVSRTRSPSSNATTRGRACDHGASRPAAQDGHASRRAARSPSTRSGSRYSSTPAQLSVMPGTLVGVVRPGKGEFVLHPGRGVIV